MAKDTFSYRAADCAAVCVAVCILVCCLFVHAEATFGKTVASSKAKAAGTRSEKKSGFKLETLTKDLGLCKCLVSSDGFRMDYPSLVVQGDLRDLQVTIGDWETQKSFSFPMDKTSYYLGLVGLKGGNQTKSKFETEWPMTAWSRCRSFKIDDLPVTEYERHVINPPRGRTRSEYQVLAHVSFLPRKFYSFYSEFGQFRPAEKYAFVVADKVVITNPTVQWSECNTKSAKKVMLDRGDVSFPKGFQKVGTISELFLTDKNKLSPEMLRLKDKLAPRESVLSR